MTSGRPFSWPHQVGVIPRRADSFQHRSLVEALENAVATGRTTVLGQVLTGMGGVGKTQLAAHYARHAWQTGAVDLLVWVTATSRSAVITGYAQAGSEVTGLDALGAEAGANAFLAWLEPKAHGVPNSGTPSAAHRGHDCRWLVVLDDVADPADLNGLWPPEHPNGRILVTTRRRDAALTGPNRHLINVGLFTAEESVAYLAARLSAHGRAGSLDQLHALAADLGHLPLALSQAVAYVIDADLDCERYRELLTGRATSLAELTPETAALPDDQAATIAAAWSLSVERADRMRPAGVARSMLRLAAVLNPNGIPAAVLNSPAVRAYLAEHRSPVESCAAPDAEAANTASLPQRCSSQSGSPVATEAEAVGALRALHRLSLIDHTPRAAGQAVRVHQLIQRAVRDTLSLDQLRRLARNAADALLQAWPEIERDTDLAQSLRANCDAVSRLGEKALCTPGVHPVLYRNGRSLGESGQPGAAVRHFEALADAAGRHLGSDHRDTLTARGGLARWRGEAGDPVGAAAAFTDVLVHRTRALGPDDPHTLRTRVDHVHWQGRAGDAVGAAAACEELLPDITRVLGPDHSDTLLARHNLAWWRGRAGNAVGAAEAFQCLLDDAVLALGPDHPRAVSIRHDLAYWRGEAGDGPGAVAALEESLEHTLRVLGPEHLDTLTARSNLARWRGKTGDPVGAAQALSDLLVDRTRVLGADHPHTLATRNDAAYWRGKAGDPDGAVRALSDLLVDRTRILGADHPHTLTTRHDLAYWQGEAGDPDGAMRMLTAVLADEERVLGPDHPQLLDTRAKLAHWRSLAAPGDAGGPGAAFRTGTASD
ncbi:FxSxx-COOH system tetratricopeptide repeat protein [Streptomyces sp. NPDC041068]|uniref:FxSxx-COOH system tetratricopeptide repeat protein n=1 Tax=Streptomyces sp. NPDC041068 TaxID=3155130 RepID=UPI003407CA4A